MARTMSSATRAVTPLVAFLGLTLVASEARSAPGAFDLTSPANGAWCTATCTFTWQGAVSATSYDLYVDGAVKHAAVATTTYTLAAGEALAADWHTWSVVAKDSGGGATSSTSTFSVRVDSTPPASFTLLTPSNNAFVPSSPATFTWSASSDGESGLDHYEIWVNGAVAKQTIPASATSGQTAIPSTAVFSDGFSSLAGWTEAPTNQWACKLENDIGSYACNLWALATSGTLSSTLTSASVDLSNVGNAQLVITDSVCGPTTYDISVSDGSAAGFRLLRMKPADYCNQWKTAALALDDLTGGSTSAIRLSVVVTPFNRVLVDSMQVLGVTGGTYSWSVVAADVAGNRTTSESRQFQYDVPPLPFDLVAPATGTWTANPQPAFSWNATTDAGSGLAKYQLWIDRSLAIDDISAAATSAVPAGAMADGSHEWWVAAVDVAGASRLSRQTWSVRIDTTPPSAFSLAVPADRMTAVIPTPDLCWYCTYDLSGVDHYELVVDGQVARGGIADPGAAGNCGTPYASQVCATPTAALAEGAHTWTARAVDKAGNVRAATESWTVHVDFNPPAAFALLSPAQDATVDTLTPTFSWQASSSSGSGLDHYELYVDDICTECAIPSTATTVTVGSPIAPSPNPDMGVVGHLWSVWAVDKLGGVTVASGAPWRFAIKFECVAGFETCSNGIDDDCDGLVDCADPYCAGSASCPSVAEPGRDGGADLAGDVLVLTDGPEDVPTERASTSDAVIILPDAWIIDGINDRAPDARWDVLVVSDALVADAIPGGPDALRSDVIANPDAAQGNTDAILVNPDALLANRDTVGVTGVEGGTADTRLPMADAGTTPGSGLDGLSTTALDSGTGALDGAGPDGATTGKSGSSGCGCEIGGIRGRESRYWVMAGLGILVLLVRLGRSAARSAKPRNSLRISRR
ncbi:MAG: hypothetical protein JXQ75_01045 [Phycisphaerae bacterium]|nr:hypothetical protein [Phycisphaerae bacterium]